MENPEPTRYRNSERPLDRLVWPSHQPPRLPRRCRRRPHRVTVATNGAPSRRVAPKDNEGIFSLALVMGKTTGQGEGMFPLTLMPSWDVVHHLNELAGIGSFLLTIFLVYLALRPTVQVPDDSVAQPTGRPLSIR